MDNVRFRERGVTVVESHNGAEEPGIGELFADLANQSRTLVIQEVALAKAELSQKMSQATKGLTYLAIGGAIAYAGFLALVGAAIFGLALFMPAWLAALIVGVVVAIIGYVLVQMGLNDLKPKDLKPEQTIESVKETREWAKKTDLTIRREHVSVSDYDNKKPEEIRDDIQNTRAGISHTVDLLQERLDPDRLKGEAQDKVREATIGRFNSMADDMGRKAKRARYTVMETIKDNPVPSALVGLGLGWLLVEGFSQSSRPRYKEDYWIEERYYPIGEGVYAGELYEYEVEPYEVGDEYRSRSRVRESFDRTREKGEHAVDRAREQASHMGQQAREQVSEMSQQAREQAENLGSQVKEQAEYLGEEARHQMDYMSSQARRQARRAKGQFDTMLEENPLAVGAAALALGVALGLSVPETRYEDEYFGPMRDDLLDKAQDKAEEVMHKVEDVAGEALESAGKTTKEEAGQSPGHVAREAAKSAAQTAKQEAQRQTGQSSSGSTTPGSTTSGSTTPGSSST